MVKFANSPTSVKSVMGIPLAPFIPTCRGFYQPYRSTSTSSYRYSPMNVPVPTSISATVQPVTSAAASLTTAPLTTAAYCTPSLVDPSATLLHHQTLAALNGFTAATLPAATPGSKLHLLFEFCIKMVVLKFWNVFWRFLHDHFMKTI